MEKNKQGKVRNIYKVDEKRWLIVASDRLSAYDVIFPDSFEGKGIILTKLSKWWMARLKDIIPNHWLGKEEEFAKNLTPENLKIFDSEYVKDLPERSMLVEKCDVIPFECIVRGYAFGSYVREHPEIEPMTKFDSPLFTPSTKAESGHDENISFEQMAEKLGETADYLKEKSIELFQYASQIFDKAGILLVDTKFEFGYGENGEIKLIDECFTPDSSRFFLKKEVEQGKFFSYDKQVVRDYVDKIGWDHNPPAPKLPEEVIEETLERYRTILDKIRGVEL